MKDPNINSDPIRIVIVDDYEVVRSGFSSFLKAHIGEFELVGYAANASEAIEVCLSEQPDIVLMDLMMPDCTGIDAIRVIHAQAPAIQCIVLTSFIERRDLIPAALQAGALAYLYKDASINQVADAIRSVHRGEPFLPPDILHKYLQVQREKRVVEIKLTQREHEVLRQLTLGLSNQGIAKVLHISLSTVKYHVSHILSKLGAGSRTEAVSLAYQYHLIDD